MTMLLGEDARKFIAQARYGRPKRAAVEAVRRGVELARELAECGVIRFRVASCDTHAKRQDRNGLGPEDG